MDPRAFRRPIEPPRGASPDDAFDPECFDFTAYLARRLGVGRELASDVLGEWLRAYEPVEFSSPAPAAPPAADAPRSGPRVSSGVRDVSRTGTDG